jgi:type III secretion system chaperone SycN
MDWIATTIEAFGQTLGIAGLSLDDDGLLAMEAEDGAELAIRDLRSLGAPELLVVLTKAVAGCREDAVRSALRLGDFRRSNAWAVQAGLDEDDLTIAVRLPIGAVMLSNLEQAVDLVLALHREADHGA